MKKTLIALILLFVVFFAIGEYFRIGTQKREFLSNTDAAPSGGLFVQAEDVSMFVQDLGDHDAPAIVFIHGTGGWSETWRDTMKAVAGAGFRAVALDLPPFGYSTLPANGDYSREAQAKRILGAMAQLEVHYPILVGHSFGARATMSALRENSMAAQEVIFVDPAFGLPTTEGGAVGGPGLVGTALGWKWLRDTVTSATLTNPSYTPKLLGDFVFQPEKLGNQIVSIYQRPMNQLQHTAGVSDWMYQFLVTPDPALISDVQTLEQSTSNMPIHLIWGDKDSVTPVWQAKELQKYWPTASIVVMKDVGHIPQIENTDEFNRIILQIASANRSSRDDLKGIPALNPTVGVTASASTKPKKKVKFVHAPEIKPAIKPAKKTSK